MLLSPIRESVHNVTEIGLAAGQSVQTWYRFFPNAHIHSFDIACSKNVEDNLKPLMDRVHIHINDLIQNQSYLNDSGFVKDSMDIVISDGPHNPTFQEAALSILFPYVKPGGYYIIEDIQYRGGGILKFHDQPNLLQRSTKDILQQHDAVWMDTTPGHRAWNLWLRRVGSFWAVNHTHHNSYLLVIQKRETPLREIKMNFGEEAMEADKIILEGDVSGNSLENSGNMTI